MFLRRPASDGATSRALGAPDESVDRDPPGDVAWPQPERLELTGRGSAGSPDRARSAEVADTATVVWGAVARQVRLDRRTLVAGESPER